MLERGSSGRKEDEKRRRMGLQTFNVCSEARACFADRATWKLEQIGDEIGYVSSVL
jgi:hypothetical protein